MAGKLMQDEALKHGVRIFPVDSEHSAIFQSIGRASDRQDVQRVILTASGGPCGHSRGASLPDVTPEQALQHPNWKMGDPRSPSTRRR